jgi:hypothetical protein
MLTSGLYGKQLSNSFNSAIAAPAQKIKPKVIIKWMDSRHLDNLVVTTNDAPAVNSYPSRGFFFPASEAFNGIRRQSFTWAVAGAVDADGDVIKADGSWYAMPSLTTNDLSNTQMGSSLEFGWWSNSVSNSNTHATYDGYGFVTNPYIQATFTTRKVNKIRIITSEFYGQISTYLLQAYDGSLNLVLDEIGTIPDGGYYRDHILSEALSTNNISKIKVTVYTTKNPGDYARIQEIVPIYEEDISEYVISYSVNRTRDIHSTSLPIGGSETASVDLTLDNTEKLFNIFNSSSTYGKYMVKDLEVEIYTGWRIKKPSGDDLNSSVLTTQLQANISNSSSTFSVLDRSSLPSGGAGNYFTVTIDEGTQSEEVVLCSSVDSSNVVTVAERGYGNTTAKSHTTGATVSFDIYEYVKNGTFYVDEWSVGTDMTVGANLQDWSKFLSERSINYGFFLQNAYVGDAVKNLLMRANFPSADIKKLNTYKQGAKDREAVSLYSFNEQTIDRSGNSIIPSTGLRARFWGMPTNQKNVQSVKDIVADAIDKELSPMDKALGEKSFVSPALTLLSKSISTSNTSALDISNYSFTGNDSAVYSEYFNGVFDGYYIPTDSGLQKLIVFISYGGVRLYLDDILILDKYQTTTSSTRYESSMVNLSAGVPRKIRIEFFHSFNNSGSASFSISLYKALSGGSDVIVSAAECCTIVPLDAIGSKNSSSTWSTADSYNHRNNGVYINNPKLSQPTGLTSDLSDKSVLLESNSYVRIPYTVMNDLSYKDKWTIEFFGKFHNGSFATDGEYISNWNNSTSTSGFEFFNNSTSNGFKIKTVLGNSAVVTETVSSNVALSNSSSSHIAVTYDGSSLKYFVNGDLKDTEVVEGVVISSASKDITIGGRGASYTPVTGVEIAPSSVRSFYADEFAIYGESLADDEIKNRYIESAMQPLTQFAFLYGNETSIREIMNDITFADMGRIYIDENDKAKYEHFYRFFEPSIDQHANVQSYFSDSTNIINSNYNVALQCNKVVIPIASIQTSTNAVQSLWIAPDGSSLATTKLTSNLTSNANVAYVSTTLDPVYSETGYIKINSEIIKYISKTATSFNGLERAQFQTTAASHSINDKVRESRYYDIKFDKSPAYNVKAPFISAILFENPKKVEITRYLPYPYGAEMILSASEDSEVGGLVFLQGTDPLTKYPYATVLSGTAVVMSEQNVQVKEQSASLADSIKKYGVKDITIQSPFITDSVHAKKLADFIIEKTQIPVPIINLDVTAMPKIQLGDRIRVTNLSALDISNTDYWVISHNTTIGDNVSQNLVLRKVS